MTGVAGKVFNAGKTLTFTAKDSIEVRTGSSSATYFTLNGDSLGASRDKRQPGDVAVPATGRPRKTNRR